MRAAIRWVLCPATVIVLASCASKPARYQETAPGKKASMDFSEPVKAAPAPPPPPILPEEKPKVSAPAVTDALTEAIKSQSEDRIFQAAVQALALNPKDAVALNALGLYHLRRGQYSAAEYFFSLGIKYRGEESDLHNNLALAYWGQGNLRGAIKEFRKAIELNPHNTVAAANIGSIYVLHKDYPKALVALEMAYKKNSSDIKVINDYAIAAVGNGKYELAESLYKEALKAQSGNKDIMFNYAVFLVDHKKSYQEGIEYINKLKFLGPSSETRQQIYLLENRAKAGLK